LRAPRGLRGSRSRRTALLLELREQRVERALDHHRQVARRVAVAHEIARAFELVAKRGASRELQLVARVRERLEARSHGRGPRHGRRRS
jgi:hypothetical protein